MSSIRRDVYANLLRDTRGMRREQSNARDRWYSRLPWEHKEDALFELEMLLKGFGCFGNARNHPGAPRRVPDVAHDFREELRILRDALQRAIDQIRALLGQKDRAYVFSRYLESVLPEDSERTRLIREQLTQDTPEEALFLMRNSFGGFVELADGLLRLGRIPHRLFNALLGSITREVGRNAYFNPLVALEFRPEFDRIRAPEVLEALHAVHSESAHRVVSLTMLTLFRGLRYVSLVESYGAEPSTARRAYVILAVCRSDLRALTRFLLGQAGDVLANGLERDLLRTNAEDLASQTDHWVKTASDLISLRGTLNNTANALRIEVRRTYERELPAPGEAPADGTLAPMLTSACESLRATLHHAILNLCAELTPGKALPDLTSDNAARRAASARLRRDIWMFKQILRGFLAKAQSSSPSVAKERDSDWSAPASFVYVRQFLEHFRAIGYQLVRRADYERLDQFMAAIDALKEADLLDDGAMTGVIDECTAFYAYLERLFRNVGDRAELAETPFDKKAAVESLRSYLGAA